ncbi:hypothetical protein CERZMDRAFT_105900 [Cercospora zeae-maydis SCOH1-5]|uniref:Uncharacterized protein n=1 Tax=Cercospora zeae-maydis SCOH1-5 TaxID=717836 RepID=A0A6A6FI81_9PEZI|nr:hypothetical protein CERZMDRAFT_105900 [Cercospora zeae-maydis SCOH1-5]
MSDIEDGGRGVDSFNTTMKFVSGGSTSTFTKTPANVSRDYFEGPAPPPKTSKSRKTTSAAAAAPKKRKLGAASLDEGEQPAAPANKKRAKGKAAAAAPAAAPAASTLKSSSPATTKPLTVRRKQTRVFKGKNAVSRPIPRTLNDCDEVDKMLIEWRERGVEWGPIKAEWKRLTGETTAVSTLPNRYTRLKTNFAVLLEEDNAILIQAKREIEDSFQAQKWSLVANVLHSKGGSDYTSCPVVLQRQWKKLMVNAGAVIPPGVKDKDFEETPPPSDVDDDNEGEYSEHDGERVEEESDEDYGEDDGDEE